MALVSRFFDWCWLTSAARAARERSVEPSGWARELVERAALATEAAERTERPAEPFLHGGSEAVAAELYRQAIHWALLAHTELGSSAADGPRAKDNSLAGLLERTDRALLAHAAGSDAELDAVRPRLLESYREFADLEPAERRTLVAGLARLTKGLLEPFTSVRERLTRVWVGRLVRVLALLVVLTAAGVGARQYYQTRELTNDLAPHATWTTSSRLQGYGCESPAQRCEGGENFFFHTIEESNPWIMFDLGRERKVSAVRLVNRLDACFERAKPIVIEVGNDAKSWKQVAKHRKEFASIRLSFPTETVRYVRVRIPRSSAMLHLSGVRIFP